MVEELILSGADVVKVRASSQKKKESTLETEQDSEAEKKPTRGGDMLLCLCTHDSSRRGSPSPSLTA